jgi:hypothetical protein
MSLRPEFAETAQRRQALAESIRQPHFSPAPGNPLAQKGFLETGHDPDLAARASAIRAAARRRTHKT